MNILKKRAASVIVPVYNSADYLPDALESLINQTENNIEIILVDDGSIDHIDKVIRNYENAIRLIRQENQGKSAAKNNGILQSSTNLIAFLDADDVSDPRRIECQVNYLHQHPEIGVVGSELFYIDRDKRFIGYQKMPVEDLHIRWHALFRLPCYNIMVRKEILDEYHIRFPIDYPYAEDYSFLVDILRHTAAHNIPEPLLSYRIHGRNETRRNLDSRLEYHVPIVLKALDQELGVKELSLEWIWKLCALFLEGIRHYPYQPEDRVELAKLLLQYWNLFKEIHESDADIEVLEKQVLVQISKMVIYPPLPPGWLSVIKNCYDYSDRLPGLIIENIFQSLKNMIKTDRIRSIN